LREVERETKEQSFEGGVSEKDFYGKEKGKPDGERMTNTGVKQ